MVDNLSDHENREKIGRFINVFLKYYSRSRYSVLSKTTRFNDLDGTTQHTRGEKIIMAKKDAKPAPAPAPAPKAEPKKEVPAKKPAAEGAADFIAKAPIRRLMKNQGAQLVAEEAVLVLIDFLEKYGTDLTKKALDIAGKDKRKRIASEDILAASK